MFALYYFIVSEDVQHIIIIIIVITICMVLRCCMFLSLQAVAHSLGNFQGVFVSAIYISLPA
jgi:hypothetical protein